MALIEVRGLRKTYGRTVAVDSLDLDVAEGQVVGVLGPNGAGKTTTVECVAGLTRPDGGTVTVAGHVPWRDRGPVTRLLGVQLQSSALPAKLTAGRPCGWSRPATTTRPTPTSWSTGWASAPSPAPGTGSCPAASSSGWPSPPPWSAAPRAVLLDELTTGLDPEARRRTWDLVREIRDGGTTVVLVTHLMEEAQQLCDRITVVAGGRVVAEGTPAEVVAGRAAATTMSFRPTAPLPAGALEALPGVATVRPAGDRVEVTGSDDGVRAVLRALTPTAPSRRACGSPPAPSTRPTWNWSAAPPRRRPDDHHRRPHGPPRPPGPRRPGRRDPAVPARTGLAVLGAGVPDAAARRPRAGAGHVPAGRRPRRAQLRGALRAGGLPARGDHGRRDGHARRGRHLPRAAHPAPRRHHAGPRRARPRRPAPAARGRRRRLRRPGAAHGRLVLGVPLPAQLAGWALAYLLALAAVLAVGGSWRGPRPRCGSPRRSGRRCSSR